MPVPARDGQDNLARRGRVTQSRGLHRVLRGWWSRVGRVAARVAGRVSTSRTLAALAPLRGGLRPSLTPSLARPADLRAVGDASGPVPGAPPLARPPAPPATTTPLLGGISRSWSVVPRQEWEIGARSQGGRASGGAGGARAVERAVSRSGEAPGQGPRSGRAAAPQASLTRRPDRLRAQPPTPTTGCSPQTGCEASRLVAGAPRTSGNGGQEVPTLTHMTSGRWATTSRQESPASAEAHTAPLRAPTYSPAGPWSSAHIASRMTLT